MEHRSINEVTNHRITYKAERRRKIFHLKSSCLFEETWHSDVDWISLCRKGFVSLATFSFTSLFVTTWLQINFVSPYLAIFLPYYEVLTFSFDHIFCFMMLNRLFSLSCSLRLSVTMVIKYPLTLFKASTSLTFLFFENVSKSQWVKNFCTFKRSFFAFVGPLILKLLGFETKVATLLAFLVV